MTTKMNRAMWGMPKVNLGTCVPNRCIVKMPYFQSFSLQGAGAAYVDYTFSMTSIFDPNVTGTGHNPRFYDQWALLYGYYRVRGVKIRVEGNNRLGDVTEGTNQIVGSAFSDYSAGSTNIEDIIESPYAAGFLKNHWKIVNAAAVSYAPNKYIRKTYFNNDKMRLAIYPVAAANPEQLDLYAQFGADPGAMNMFFNLYTGNWGNDIDTNANYEMSIKLTYIVELTEPVFQSES